ncbi:hypothetical protein JCM3765_002395 [Sporobolomyces pararoseus]
MTTNALPTSVVESPISTGVDLKNFVLTEYTAATLQYTYRQANALQRAQVMESVKSGGDLQVLNSCVCPQCQACIDGVIFTQKEAAFIHNAGHLSLELNGNRFHHSEDYILAALQHMDVNKATAKKRALVYAVSAPTISYWRSKRPRPSRRGRNKAAMKRYKLIFDWKFSLWNANCTFTTVQPRRNWRLLMASSRVGATFIDGVLDVSQAQPADDDAAEIPVEEADSEEDDE